MFAERLETLSDRIDGTRAVCLVAKDGIPVEWHAPDPDLDLEMLSAELMSQVRAISQNHQELAVGAVRHFAVSTDHLILMVSEVTSEYYLLLVLAAGSNQGLARFELRRAVLRFENDLV